MRYSQLFGKTQKEVPKEAKAVSHQYLIRAGFVYQLAAGLYEFLPLGFIVLSKLDQIIKEELAKKGVQHLLMPLVHPASLWKETGRYDKIDVLLKFTSARGTDSVLAPTHEETVTDLARKYIHTYKDLPVIVNQNQWKYRDELRATGGLLRTREFLMQDAYSFDRDKAGLDESFDKMVAAYHAIFERIGIEVVVVKADSGTMGGSDSQEFAVIADVGEDRILMCNKCEYRANIEVADSKEVQEDDTCMTCHKGKLQIKHAIEIGHVFKLGTCYSEWMKANFMDKDGKQKPLVMGCYGIGISRLIAGIVEASHDDKGIIWPKSVAPFQVEIVTLGKDEKVAKEADKLYKELKSEGVEVLYDDRDESAGVKLNDADLMGMPLRLVISARTLEKGSVEWKERNEKDSQLVKLIDLADRIGKKLK